MADTSYDAQFGFPFSFTFTPISGSAFGSTQAQAEESTPPETTKETVKFTPITGPNAGVEQSVGGRTPTQTFKIKCTYAAAAYSAALTCWENNKKGQLVCTYDDGVETYGSGGTTTVVGSQNLAQVTGIQLGSLNATGLRTMDITITTPMPPTFIPS